MFHLFIYLLMHMCMHASSYKHVGAGMHKYTTSIKTTQINECKGEQCATMECVVNHSNSEQRKPNLSANKKTSNS